MSSNGKSREILQKRPSTHASVLDEVASRLTSTMWQLLVAVVALLALSAWAWTTVDASLARQVRSQLQTQVGSSREALDLWTTGLLDALVRASSSERVSAAFAMEGASSLPPTFAAELLVERHGAVPAARAVHLITQACGSLHEAHSRGLIHRDVKPSNIMVCERGGEHDRVKVLDFGLVKSVTRNPADPTITADGRLAGTPHYMAPECLSNPEDAGVASDVYALGAVLYFLIAGRDLFPQRDTVAVIVAQMTLEPEPLESVAPTVPPALARVIHSCLCKDPQQRPRTAKELAQRLRETIPSDAWDAERAAVWWADPSRAA